MDAWSSRTRPGRPRWLPRFTSMGPAKPVGRPAKPVGRSPEARMRARGVSGPDCGHYSSGREEQFYLPRSQRTPMGVPHPVARTPRAASSVSGPARSAPDRTEHRTARPASAGRPGPRSGLDPLCEPEPGPGLTRRRASGWLRPRHPASLQRPRIGMVALSRFAAEERVGGWCSPIALTSGR
jgi:hypothetical protein